MSRARVHEALLLALTLSDRGWNKYILCEISTKDGTCNTRLPLVYMHSAPYSSLLFVFAKACFTGPAQLSIAIRHQPALPVPGFGFPVPGQASEPKQGSGTVSLTSLAQTLIV